jgi:hypothetical protein
MSVTTEVPTLSWSFGGLLAGQPPDVAWKILATAAVVGVALVVWSYQRALISVEPKRRVFLCLLRSALWLGLLLVLAAPTRIHRHYDKPAGARPLAVLVDRSSSMTAADNRQRRRLDDALRRWHEMEPAGRNAFGGVNFFTFADGVKAAPTIDAVPTLPPGETKLFSALQGVMAQAPSGGWGGVVTLTDGLDTSGATTAAGVETTTQAAAATSTALFFVPGRNRYAGQDFFELRDFNAPAQAAPRTTFRVEATFESFQPKAKDVAVQFKVNGKPRPAEALHLEGGRRLSAWSAEVSADGPGVIDLELRAGDEIARAAVRVELPPTNRILYFQGALDWSYRFLADILKRDASFTLTPVFNFPNPNAALPAGAMKRMPATVKELEAFDIVILANAAASQFSPAQQAALSSWVRDGGVLLFFTPDDDSSQGFAGSELEKMLPVLFDGPNSSKPLLGKVTNPSRTKARGGSGTADATKLVPFEWEQSPRVQEIFATAEKQNATLVSPLFSEYAHVAQAKPGADVLARHPKDLARGGSERAILLATQRYGRGQSGVLTTDALWRWKLNQPASERGAEIFWQNLFAWLTRERQVGLRFDRAPRLVKLGGDVSLRLLGAGSEPVKLDGVNANGGAKEMLVEGAGEDRARVFQWHPPKEGFWEITATDANGRVVKHWLTVKNTVRTGELSGAAPDEELLRRLAEATGGAVLENAPPPAWRETRQTKSELLNERREPLWHQPWIFGVMLGVYGLEMLLRRKWRLL